jgi:hypothetical protein
VKVPFRFRQSTKLCGFAGSGRTSSVSLTFRGTVSSIRAKSREHVFLKYAFDAANLRARESASSRRAKCRELTPSW